MNEVTRVLVTGAYGQVGSALLASAPRGIDVHGVTRSELDVCDARLVSEYVSDFRPTLIINAAAYTAVDRAESEPELAARINEQGPANLARAARAFGSRLIHISTDFVFDGRTSLPYRPDDTPAPLGVYGASKLAGEREVLGILPESALIVRTAWVYAAQGHNFLSTMLRLMNERGEVNVVADQIGTPTSAVSVAQVLWAFAGRLRVSGVFHWTDAGVASWYDFAVAIAEEASACGLLTRNVLVNPIAGHEYPVAARRPAFSVLDKRATMEVLGVKPTHWRTPLRATIKRLSLA